MKRAVRRGIQAYISISLLGFTAAYADNSHLHAFSLDKGTNAIQIQVTGEGFDPLLRVQKKTDGSYQIICEGTPLTLDPSARQSVTALKNNLKHQYPEITQLDVQEAGQTVRLVISSRQRLQPQILSNTGKLISLKLLKVKSSSESDAQGKTLDNVELDLDEQLSQRQQQEGTRRELIKAQEQAWQQQTEKKTLTNSSDSKPTITFPEPKPTPPLQTVKPITLPAEPPDVQAEPEPASPLRLTAPPPSALLNADGTQTIYQARGQSISGESLYAFINDPKVPMDVQTGIRQAFQGNKDLAKTTLQNYIQHHPNNATAQVALAMVLLNSNITDTAHDRNQAIALLNQVVSQTPYVKAYELLIDIALDDNRIPDAESLLNKAELLHANDPHLLFLKGRLLEAQNNLSTAHDYYVQTLEQLPQLTEAHYRLAQIALKSGKTKEAVWELNQILQVQPDDVRTLKLLAFINQREKQTQQALALYQKTLQPDAMLNLARLLSEQGESAKANTLLNTVEALVSSNLDLLFNVGMTYADLHNASKAKSLLNRFIQQSNSQDPRVSQAKEALKKLGR